MKGDPGMPRVGSSTRWEMRRCAYCEGPFRATREMQRETCYPCFTNSLSRQPLTECVACGELTECRSMCAKCRDWLFLCGHPREPENMVMHNANGYRYPRCRTCRAAISKRYREKSA